MKARFFTVVARGLLVVLAGWLILFASGVRVPVWAQQIQPGKKIDPSILEWPRFHTTNGYDYAIYQPQISEWPSNRLEGRLVVAVRPTGTSNETYGVIFFSTRTEIDKVNRLVTLEDFQITRADFPGQPALKDRDLSIIQSFQPDTLRVIPLDHLESVFAASQDITRVKVQSVKNDPPRIIYTTLPSLLILVDGQPILKELTGDYERVVNTRAILLRDKAPYFQNYYLYADRQWFTAPALAGPWSIPVNVPPTIQTALSAALETKQVDPMYPRDPNAPSVSQIFVSTVPAELIETTGTPNLLSVPNTDLLYVENSSTAVFFYIDDGKYYVLISGRWFKSASLAGPWAFVPPGTLPNDFKKIPADSEKSNVLLSVPGTPQAREAVIANSIPQTATIQRAAAKLEVTYLGAPSFMPIAGTPLSYAANSATPVIMVAPKDYYACQGGVWFQSVTAQGPWTVAASVPAVIYTIPASCPIHYVTYAYVYGSTPSVVYVGYTPGYMGTVVAPGGVVVYGTGYYYPPVVVGTTYVSYPPTYGYGASFALGAAVGFAFGYCAGSSSSCWCEPYWGCYHWATPYGYGYAHCNVNACNYYTHWGTAVHATGCYGYNPYTGNEWASRGATTFNPYTGTRGVVGSSATYNPYTGNAAASRGGSWYNPYSGANASASSSAKLNTQSGKYSGSRDYSGYNPTTGRYASGDSSVSGNIYSGTASWDRSGTAGNTKTGNSVSWNNGNMTSDRYGNTYTYNRGQASQNYSTAQSEHSAGQSYRQSSWGGQSGSSWANRESSYQSLGSQRFSNWSRGGGGGWGGFRGGGGWRR